MISVKFYEIQSLISVFKADTFEREAGSFGRIALFRIELKYDAITLFLVEESKNRRIMRLDVLRRIDTVFPYNIWHAAEME